MPKKHVASKTTALLLATAVLFSTVVVGFGILSWLWKSQDVTHTITVTGQVDAAVYQCSQLDFGTQNYKNKVAAVTLDGPGGLLAAILTIKTENLKDIFLKVNIAGIVPGITVDAKAQWICYYHSSSTNQDGNNRFTLFDLPEGTEYMIAKADTSKLMYDSPLPVDPVGVEAESNALLLIFAVTSNGLEAGTYVLTVTVELGYQS